MLSYTSRRLMPRSWRQNNVSWDNLEGFHPRDKTGSSIMSAGSCTNNPPRGKGASQNRLKGIEAIDATNVALGDEPIDRSP